MRHEETEFVGGPLDGRVLEVVTGMTGQPPPDYRVPVPAPEGGPETVHVYHRAPGRGRTRWAYVHDPEGRPHPDRPRWPWSKRP
ncbi:hypothetical protein [Actinacidiphila guanduensis]|uniref:Uncharacterized protein n=1 Tax=Actinacidiphila guanduensis TaxID=310781 RepID=A0A1G9ZRI2_9ACTN|nr:hypothetical protein [Actinacidiphila guanduensis]SDN23581.1 hypothetical protein SAMN05216259_103261 [Actinacidiphila guanduensis]